MHGFGVFEVWFEGVCDEFLSGWFEWVWRVVDWCGKICARWWGVILVRLGSEEACVLAAKRCEAWKWILVWL